MTVLSRLVDPQPGEAKIAVHQYTASIAERGRGNMTVSEFEAFFGFDAAEILEINNWFPTYVGGRELLHDVLMLGEQKAYDLTKCSTILDWDQPA